MKSLSFLAAGLLSAGFLGPITAHAEPARCQLAASTLDSVKEIRGLALKRKVPCDVKDREAVREYLLESIRTKIPAGRLKLDEIALKAIGFIPESYNYEDEIVGVYLSQLGGYYDPDRKMFTMAAWIPDALQMTIAAHELTHALQDQYFNLADFIDGKRENSDELLARSAIVEGDATAAMHDFLRKLQGLSPLKDDASVETLLLQSVVGGTLMNTGANTPLSVQMTLLFPYTSGLRFAHYFLRDGGYKKIDAILKQPPLSTEEILHPEKYGKSGEYRLVTDEEVLGPGRASNPIVYRDTIGEFSISLLLGGSSSSKSQAVKAAAGWGGDRIVMFEEDPANYHLVWKSVWDTELDAKEFFFAFQSTLDGAGEWKTLSPKRRVRLTPPDGKEVLFEAVVAKDIG